MRMYVAGPLHNEDPQVEAANITRAIDAAIGLMVMGHSPFCPHLSYWLDLRSQELGAGITYEDWLRLDFAWLEVSDALLFLGPSPGATRELALAESLGLTVYRSIEEVPHGRPSARGR